MKYNVYYRAHFRYSLLNIDAETLAVVTVAYLLGKKHITVGGENFPLDGMNYLKIFVNGMRWSHDEIIKRAKQHELFIDSFGTEYVSQRFLSTLGEDVTAKHIGNKGFGDDAKSQNKVANSYVSSSRMQELENISSQFNLSKLIRLCEELNFNFENGNYYSVAMLGRALIDHIAPIFGYKNFNEVSNNYGNKSIRKTFLHLNESLRNISDGILHSHVRENEVLPNSSQVNFSQDLDVLLAEIVVVLS